MPAHLFVQLGAQAQGYGYSRGLGDCSYHFEKVVGPTVVMIQKALQPYPAWHYEDGIKVAAVDAKAGQRAIDWIKGIVAEPEIGVIYTGKVVKCVEFGAFVNFLGSRDGLVHISELAPRRVAKVNDVVKEGDQVKVKVLGVDDRGKVRLGMKMVDQETGEEIVGDKKEKEEAAEG